VRAIRDLETTQKLLLKSTDNHDTAQILETAARGGAILEGHFALLSGQHSEYFLRFKSASWDRTVANLVADKLLNVAQPWLPRQRGAVICPESAGVFLGAAVARLLKWDLAVAAIDEQRKPTDKLRTGSVVAGHPALLVNDIVTTVDSAQKLENLARAHGASVLGMLAFACRNTDQWRARLAETNQKGVALFVTNWPVYEKENCPLCKRGEELVQATEFN
jgi:orotate phosphoribosyltransferase